MPIVLPWDYKHDPAATPNFSVARRLFASDRLEVISTTANVSVAGAAGTGPGPSIAARPFFVGALGVAQMRLGVNVGIVGTGNVRVGIYSTRPYTEHNLYPQALVMDMGEMPLGVIGHSLSALLAVNLTNGLYYAAFMFDGGTGSITMNTGNNGSLGVLGGVTTGTFSTNLSIVADQAYGPMPTAFPAGGSFATVQTPIYAGARTEAAVAYV